jgi:methionine synthase I (cobalamin-dependent)
MNPLASLLESHDYVLADGAMGTMLMDLGLEQGDPPEEWNVAHPDRIIQVQRAYVDVGSQILLSNTFGGNPFRLALHGLEDRIFELNKAGVENARAAAADAPHTVVIAGDIGPSGELLEPLGTRTFEELRDGFARQAEALAAGGPDVIWIETMSHLDEVRAAVEGARSATSLPLVLTMTFDTRGYTMMGVSPIQALEALQAYEPLALGANCGNGVEEIEGVIEAMHEADPSQLLVAKSNAGIPQVVGSEIVYSGTPEVMAGYAVRARELGARIIGGCCGTTPTHLEAMANALRKATAAGIV